MSIKNSGKINKDKATTASAKKTSSTISTRSKTQTSPLKEISLQPKQKPIKTEADAKTKSDTLETFHKSYNPFQRMYTSEKSAHLVFLNDGEHATLGQFNTDPKDPLNRPLQNIEDLIVSPRPLVYDFSQLSAKATAEVADTATTAGGTNNDTPLTPKTQSRVRSVFTPSAFTGTLKTPGGTEMNSKRHAKISLVDSETKKLQEGFILFLSPTKRKRKHPTRENELSIDNEEYDEALEPAKKYARIEAPKVPGRTVENTRDIASFFRLATSEQQKGGKPITVKLGQRRRKEYPGQQTVMGMSAKQAILDFIEAHKTKYDKDILEHLTLLASNAPIDWLHALSFGLSPKKFEPQTKKNLGAAPHWINTYMMVLESLAQYFAKRYPNAVKVTPSFSMLENSDIIKTIDYKVTIVNDNRELTVQSKTIDALTLRDRSNWPSSSDSAHAKRVSDALLTESEPSRRITLH